MARKHIKGGRPSKVKPTGVMIKRRCLTCSRMFKSTGPGNRLCGCLGRGTTDETGAVLRIRSYHTDKKGPKSDS